MNSQNFVVHVNKTTVACITLLVRVCLLSVTINPGEKLFVKCYPVSSLQFGREAFSENSNGDHSVLHRRRSVYDSLDAKDRRSLKQDVDSGGEDDCSLGRTEVQRLYDPGLRQWVIDDEELTRQSTLQSIVDCTEEGDIILVNTTQRINVTQTIVLSKSLTISAYTEDIQLLDNVFPRAENKVAFSCPRNESLFRIMNSNITLANLIMERCHFEGQVATSVITVDRCQRQSMGNVLHLHHVLIQNIANTVGSGVIDMDNDACVSAEMVDVQISNNTCGGVACIRLSGSCNLTHVNISSNDGSGLSQEDAQAVIYLEANDARLTINNVRAQGNGLRVFYVKNVERVFISDSNFTQNGNSEVSFGGVFRLDNSSGIISHSMFNSNTASTGGSLSMMDSNFTIENQTSFSSDVAGTGAAIHIENSQVVANKVTFSNCRANRGGSVYLEGKSRVSFQNSTFNGNGASNHGGAVYALSSSLFLERVHMLNNTCRTFGGAIIAEGSELKVTRSSFTNNSAAKQNGGAIRLEARCDLTLSDTNFTQNHARFGGAIQTILNGVVHIEQCIFVENSAAMQGGALETNTSDVTISGSVFMTNRASSGGAVSATQASVSISDCRFNNNSASNKGGALQIQTNGFLTLTNSTCSRNTAGIGGCACVGVSSQLLSISTSFLENYAKKQYGGAFFINRKNNMNITLQLENCTLRGNKGPVGGAIYVDRDALANETCHNNATNCGGVALLGTDLTDNVAKAAGSAIFTNDENAVRVACVWSPQLLSRTVISVEDYLTLRTLSNDTICSSWSSKDNSDQAISSLVAFRARKASVTVLNSEQTGVAVEYLTEEIKITNFKSGDALPGIKVQMMDAFGHTPAFLPNLRLRGRFHALDRLFQGTVFVDLSEGEHVLSDVRAFGRPGIYALELNFSDSSIPAVHISVQVRDCIVGEFTSADGVICEQCGDNFFRFIEGQSKDCQTCPTHANCSARFVFPENGYWNHHPCQTAIKKCLETSACTNEERFNQLLRITRNHQTCSYEHEEVSEYTTALCSKGYSGVLCGSCAAGYGRSGTFTCGECWSTFISICVLIATTMWLLTLAFVVIRSNLPMAERKSDRSRTLPQTTDEQTTTSTPQTPINIEMVRRMCAGVVSRLQLESRPLTPEEETVELKDVEIAKWKLGEMLKLIVNYTQTVAIAAYLNVDWTASITTAFAVAETIGGFATHAVTRSIYCLSDQGTPLHGPLFSTIAGLVQPMLVCLIIILLFSRLHRPLRSNRVLLLKKAALVAAVVAYICYFNIAKMVTRVFPCVDLFLYESIDQSSAKAFWASDTSLECYESEHVVLLILGSFVLLFFTITFPILTLLVLLYHRSKDTLGASWVFDTLGFMYKAFRKKYVYWESVVLLRKALLSLILVFSNRLRPELQSQLAAFVLVFSLYLQMKCNPYGRPFFELNDYESLSLFMTSSAFISASFFHHEETLESTKILIACLLLAGNISFFLFLALKFLKYLIQYCRVYIKFLGVLCPNTTPFWHVIRLFLSMKIGPIMNSN